MLPAPRRNRSGYRLYSSAERDRLRFIAKAKSIGFTLREIKQILALRDGGGELFPYLSDLLARKLAAIDTQLRLLSGVRDELVALREEIGTTVEALTHAEAIFAGLLAEDLPARRPRARYWGQDRDARPVD